MTRDKISRTISIVILPSILLALGGMVYLVFLSNIWPINWIYNLLGFNWEILTGLSTHTWARFIRNYMPDVLWAWALIILLYGIWNPSKKSHRLSILLLYAAFTVALEILQFFKIVNGFFDAFDIVTYLIVGVLYSRIPIISKYKKTKAVSPKSTA